MKLRTISLVNVRRFAGHRATLADIGDGITVLAEPNEFGKSTFFDALHALFFERHRSTRAQVKALQPHAGGAPAVEVTVELPEGQFGIAKRWLQRPMAEITDATGRPLAREDEAEAWIDRLIGGDLAGPSGLLWVRQGLTALEPEGAGAEEKRLRERGLSARRDLLSSVAGEVDLMTGGRRMDAILHRVGEAIDRLATASGKPRAGGEWYRAVEEAKALAAEEADLRPRAERLSGDLAARTQAQRRLARLTDAADAAQRLAALQSAEAAHAAALAHHDRLAQAQTALRLAELDGEAARREVARVEGLIARLDQAQEAVLRAEAQVAAARARADELQARDVLAAGALASAADAAQLARSRVDAAMQARAARTARQEAAALQQRLDRALALQAALDADRAARARISVTAGSLAAAETAQSALDLARARAEARAVTVEAFPDGEAARIGDRPLPPGPSPVHEATDLVLPGFGRLRVDPGQGRGETGLQTVDAAARQAAAALAATGEAGLAAARLAFAEAQRLDAALAQSAAVLAELAPDGVDALRIALSAAVAAVEAAHALSSAGEPAAEDLAALRSALAAADLAEGEARAAARSAHDLAVAAGEARAEAEGERRTARRRAEEAQAEAGARDALLAELAARTEELPARLAAAARASDDHQALLAAAPDLPAAEAALARARGAVEQARRDEAQTREDLARLNATIAAHADEGIEERLSALTEARAVAEARAQRFEAEVQALSRLRAALDAARAEARDAYYGPVLRELQPLLAILHPGAQLQIDDGSLLPAALTRDGQAELIDILSGGTREQIAVLTRLAFARLFARTGRSVPVILDDALVHSDDDRIVAMFTALHHVARDQQILVLTCRQRAFADLGGRRADVRVEAA